MSSSAVQTAGVAGLRRGLNVPELGLETHERIRLLYPISRSITGNGVRETLSLVSREIDLASVEVPSGTKVFDWVVPKEWNIKDAYIKDRAGTRVVDFHRSNLHVVGYSVPVHERLRLEALRPHLFSIPDHPDWIPYRTSYYSPTWGFCLSHKQLQGLQDEEYEVCIDSCLVDGYLTFGECVLPGRESSEVLLSAHVCHPSLCNDNLSGISVAVTLARLLTGVERRHTYRFLFAPGTIGAIAWLALNEAALHRIKYGLVLACIGDPGPMTYKRSRRGDAEIDRAAAHVLRCSAEGHQIRDFSPHGYDERQYCSPGFNLPVGVLSRTPYGSFPEYHTSADGLALVTPEALADSLEKLLAIVEVLENNDCLRSRNLKCEPQLGARGLYSPTGGYGSSHAASESALLWVLNLSDGAHSLLDIAERSGLSFSIVCDAARTLERHDLLARDTSQQDAFLK